MIERGSPLRIRVFGFSMMPLIQDGDVVTIAPLAGRAPAIGEVVAFVLPGTEKLALHRVVAREGPGWLLRGDNCPDSDGVVVGAEILGRITRVERDGREVPFGSGLTGAGVAWLSRVGVLGGLRVVRRVVRRPAASALRHVQGCAWYRAAGRRLAARFVIAEASDMDVWWAERRLGLFELDSAPLGTAGQAVSGWVAKRGGRVIGFVRLVTIADAESPWKGHWLSSLTVRERYRGLGVGEALAWRAVEDAASRGVSAVWLGVREDNRSALGLSRKLEFEPVASDRPETTFAGEERAATRKHVILRKALEDRAVSA
ncbi:MAG: hypothetical protein A2133_10825 [Actinobacteria bacterium RBG_16_64_13]|nr:MAG: hypothetical protein A2133_10825 [Actinobacteria bacterium RBG_16_64_13]